MFVYLDEGFYVMAEEIPKTLTPEIRVHAPTFFVPSTKNVPEGRDVASVFLIPWQGFQNYEFYCRDSEGGKACRE